MLINSCVCISNTYISRFTRIKLGYWEMTKINLFLQTKHNQVEVNCPKMGKPNRPAKYTLRFHNNMLYNVKSRMPETVSTACHNPMGGQLITMAGLPIRPQFHFPNSVGNEKMSGFAFNMFMLYAKLYGFRTKLFFRGGGTYMPQNRTFTPGAFSAVSIY